MKVLNYNQVLKGVSKHRPGQNYGCVRIHKKHTPDVPPKVSVILLDWSCRERFDSLDWLLKQDVPKEAYELIWVELYERVMPEVFKKADTVITCGQKGMYHKHIGYNAGLLNSFGEIIVICDSDAVYPEHFISSIIKSFYPDKADSAQPLVLMHYQLRTSFLYPGNLKDREELKDNKWQWWPLNPNAGACMSVRKQDAIRFGGFDEHKSFKGYLCGPYDLGWRLVNAGIPEYWHDISTVLWHFAHPDPVGVNEIAPTLKRMHENAYPHVDLHALTAVEAFSTGRFQPLKENQEIFKLRMKERFIGTEFEEKYANMTGGYSFSKLQISWLRISMFLDILATAIGKNNYQLLRSLGKKLLSIKNQPKKSEDRRLSESAGKPEEGKVNGDVANGTNNDAVPVEVGKMILLSDMKPISDDKVARVRGIYKEIEFLANSRKTYIKKHNLNSQIYLPAGLWSNDAPNDFRKFYKHALKCNYDTVNNLRFFVQPFSGYHLMPKSIIESRSSVKQKLREFNRQIEEIAHQPDEFVYAWIKATRHMPDELVVNPPRMLGEIGWDVKGIVVNHDTYVYQERVNLMYESGLISWLMKRMSENKQLTILEIGAGYGALAYFLKGLFPKANYIICDLPESMLFSAAYLYLTRPDVAHSIYNGKNPQILGLLNSGYSFVVNYMFEDLSNNSSGIDLVLNTLSFSEMSEAQVRYYASRIKQLIGKTGVLFEQNQDNKHLGLLYCKEQLGEYFKYRQTITSDTIRQPPQGIADIWANVAVRQLIPEDLKIQDNRKETDYHECAK